MKDLGSKSISVTYQLHIPVYVNFSGPESIIYDEVRTIMAHLTPELLGGF